MVAGIFHYLRLRAYAHATEDPERVRAAMRSAGRWDAIELNETELEGSHKNPIRIFEGDVKANPRIQAVFEALARDDPEGYARLREEAPRRMDEHDNFYFRLDKQEAFRGRAVLASDDDAILIRGRVRSFGPKQKPLAEDVVGFLGEIAPSP